MKNILLNEHQKGKYIITILFINVSIRVQPLQFSFKIRVAVLFSGTLIIQIDFYDYSSMQKYIGHAIDLIMKLNISQTN